MNKEIINYSYIHGLSFAKDNVPRSYPEHWHNSAEFTLILEKGCEYTIGEERFYPDPGDILFVWPRELHEIRNAPPKGYILIQFSPTLVESSTDIVTAIRFLSKCHHISKKKDPELSKKLSDYISEFVTTYDSNLHFIETRCKIIIYNILLLVGEYILEEHRELVGNEQFSDATWEYIRTACSYISEHSSEDISQTEVASITGLSPFYFSKIFKEYTQMTFPAYLANIRVQNAINLLSNEQMSITDCAFMAGFQSTTTFNKIFRETTGCTPREYRKLHTVNKSFD